MASIPNVDTNIASGYNLDMSGVSGTLDTLSSLADKATSFISSEFSNSESRATEADKPSVPIDIANQNPNIDQPTTPRASVGDTGPKTSAEKSNKTLKYNCDFTINMKTKVCKKTIEIIAFSYTKTLETKVSSFIEGEIPFLQNLKNMYKTIKGWYDWVMKYVNMVKAFIKCMIDIIAAITAVVQQLMSLPMTVLSQAVGCINGFKNLMISAVTETVNGIATDVQNQASSVTAGDGVSSAKTSMDAYYNQYSDAIAGAIS